MHRVRSEEEKTIELRVEKEEGNRRNWGE